MTSLLSLMKKRAALKAKRDVINAQIRALDSAIAAHPGSVRRLRHELEILSSHRPDFVGPIPLPVVKLRRLASRHRLSIDDISYLAHVTPDRVRRWLGAVDFSEAYLHFYRQPLTMREIEDIRQQLPDFLAKRASRRTK